MRFDKYLMTILCFLSLVIPATLAGCEKQEKHDPLMDQKLHFYKGLEIEPIYSQSKVESVHSRYEFSPVLQGDIVHHDFIIANDGDKALEITEAAGCCGLIVESYARRIEPGMTGKIAVLILTDSQGGQEIKGTISAKTADSARPRITIDVSIFVQEFAALSPYRIWLKGSPDQEIVEKCRVVPNEAFPFRITGIKVRKGVWFTYDFREVETDGKAGYEIMVRNTRKKIGSYQDVLFIQTDHPRRPEFKIRIEGRIGGEGTPPIQ